MKNILIIFSILGCKNFLLSASLMTTQVATYYEPSEYALKQYVSTFSRPEHYSSTAAEPDLTSFPPKWETRDGVRFLPINRLDQGGYIPFHGFQEEDGNGEYTDRLCITFRVSDIPTSEYTKIIISPFAYDGVTNPTSASIYMFQSSGILAASDFSNQTNFVGKVLFSPPGEQWYKSINGGTTYLGDSFFDVTQSVKSARENGWGFVGFTVKAEAPSPYFTMRKPMLVASNYDIDATNAIPEPNSALASMIGIGALILRFTQRSVARRR